MNRSIFRCASKIDTGLGAQRSCAYVFTPVGEDYAANNFKDFWRWKPSGRLELNCLSPAVQFEPGKNYYIDISAVAP